MRKARLLIRDMSCGHCVSAVTRALRACPGVSNVDVTLGTADVVYDERRTREEELVRAVEDEGYAVEAVR